MLYLKPQNCLNNIYIVSSKAPLYKVNIAKLITSTCFRYFDNSIGFFYRENLCNISLPMIDPLDFL